MNPIYLLLILINITLMVIGQTIWKIGAEKLSFDNSSVIISAITSPWIISGGVLYVFATVIWIYLLSKLPFSLLYPLQSIAYVFGLIVALIIFKEVIPLTRWFGVGVILIGVFLVSK